MYREINNKMREYEEELKLTMAKFRHAIGAFEDIISFLNNNIKYNIHVHMDGNRMLLVDVYNQDYNIILDMIKKERPRLIVYTIEIKDDRCIFNISYDINWKREPECIQTSVYTDELSC